MLQNLEEMLRRVPATAHPVLHAPRHVFERLRLVAGLLKSEPAPRSGDRLLWRDEQGGVRALPIAGRVVIGRDASCEVVVSHPCASRRHCAMNRVHGGVELWDLDSQHGTRVNGTPVARRILCDGDTIECGGSVVVYVRG